MSGKLKSAAAWLGLVADDRYDSYDEPRSSRDRRDRDDHEDEYTEDVELTEDVGEDSAEVRQLESRRRTTSRRSEGSHGERSERAESPRSRRDDDMRGESDDDPRHDDEEVEPSVADLSRIVTVCPRTYNEARTIGEHFREAVPVIMNLSEMSDAEAKRLVDFAAGLIFGLRGNIERVTNKVFLLSPKNVKVTAEDKERIAGGFYNQS